VSVKRAPAADTFKPVRWLSVGITGHRPDRLATNRLDTIGTEIGAMLDRIEAAARAHGAEQLRLVSGLAEGADAIAADAALARRWWLDAVLPFIRDDYLADFIDPAARKAHEARLSASRSVFELPGERDEPFRAVAYERAGHLMLDQSDLLLAIWDGAIARGRGGAAQIVAYAVARDIPVIWIDPTGAKPATLLWDGLAEHDLGQQTIDTVPRGDSGHVDALVGHLLELPQDGRAHRMAERFGHERLPRAGLALAYPLLLAAVGVRRPRRSDFQAPSPAPVPDAVLQSCAGIGGTADAFGKRVQAGLLPRFAHADAIANRASQLFRSSYVANFGLAAIAVLLSLSGLGLPADIKPLLVIFEVAATATILVLTRTGRRGGWHERWLDNRNLAERLRCLAVGAQMGELNLRVDASSGSGWLTRATARELGLPSLVADGAYLGCVRDGLRSMLDDQIAYLEGDARRMHRLEHRLHLFGSLLFALTALICVIFLGVETLMRATLEAHSDAAHALAIAGVMTSAALPAIGAAIYGIRMQGDFAGIADRNHALAHHLRALRSVTNEDALSFDTLRRRVARATGLLTEGLENWHQTYRARPLVLPG